MAIEIKANRKDDLLEDALNDPFFEFKPKQYQTSKSTMTELGDCFLFSSIQAVFAETKQHYKDICIHKRPSKILGKLVAGTPYDVISNYQPPFYLPCAAVTCNLLVELYKHNKLDSVKEFFNQYKDDIFLQNTVGCKDSIYHYPRVSLFPDGEKRPHINTNQINSLMAMWKKRSPFESTDDIFLGDALQDDEMIYFLKNLTGLENLSDLYFIADKVQKQIYIRPPRDENFAVYIGGFNDHFTIDLSYGIDDFVPRSLCRSVHHASTSQ